VSNSVGYPFRSTREQREAYVAATVRFTEAKTSTKYFEAAPCEGPGCPNIVPAGYYPANRGRSFCSDDCRIGRRRDANRRRAGRPAVAEPDPERQPATKYFEAAPCEGPGCSNVVPAGMYAPHRKRAFCSEACRERDANTMYVLGTCACGCGELVLGARKEYTPLARADFQDSFKIGPEEPNQGQAEGEDETSVSACDCEGLQDWLGGRDSNPDNVVQRRKT